MRMKHPYLHAKGGTLALALAMACNPDPAGSLAEDDERSLGGATSEHSLGTDENPSDCALVVAHSQSEEISSVFTVYSRIKFPGADRVSIRFGKVNEGFTLTAPARVGLASTVLLGMTHSTDYQYQLVATSGDEQCVSEIVTISTGALPGGSSLRDATINAGSSTWPVEPGFIVSSSGVGPGRYVYIVNHEGELVWWYEMPFGQITRARMSYDGEYMFARELNLAGGDSGLVAKVSMDGSGEELINLPGSHHDFTVTPDGGLLYIATEGDYTNNIGKGPCDGIYKYPSGELLFKVFDAFPTYKGDGGTGELHCHTNAIQYNAFDNSVTVSETNHHAYINFDYETGELNWVYGGERDSDFKGDSTWEREHGLHMTDPETLYFFNNGSLFAPQSTVYRARLHEGTATWDWEYSSNDDSGTLGDVQELPNGNVLVTYSSGGGVLHEVDPQEQLIRKIRLPFTNSGYSNHRPTLYGSPPR